MARSVRVDVPAGVDLAEAKTAIERALKEVLARHEVRDALAKAETAMGPGQAAQLALREERWRQVEATWGLLTAAEVATLTGAKPEGASAKVSNLRRRNGLLGIKRGGVLRYPGFFFVDGTKGASVVAPAWSQLKEMLAATGWSEADTIAWVAAPNVWLEGRSPAQEIQHEPDQVTPALARAAAEAIPDPSGQYAGW